MKSKKNVISGCLILFMLASILFGCANNPAAVSTRNEAPTNYQEPSQVEKDILEQQETELSESLLEKNTETDPETNTKIDLYQEALSVQETTGYPVVEGQEILLSQEELDAFYKKIGFFTDEKSPVTIWLPTKGMLQGGDPTCWETYPVIISDSDVIELKEYRIFYCPWVDIPITREPIKFTSKGIPMFKSQKHPQKLVALIDREPVEFDVGLEQIWDFKPHPFQHQVAVYGSDKSSLFHIVLLDLDNKSLTPVFRYKSDSENGGEGVFAELDFDHDGNLYFDTFYAKERGIYIYSGQKTEKLLNKAFRPRISPDGKYLAFYLSEPNGDFLTVWDIDKKTVIGRIKKWGNPVWEFNGQQLYIESAREIIKFSWSDSLVTEGILVDGIPFVYTKERTAELYSIYYTTIMEDPVIKKVAY